MQVDILEAKRNLSSLMEILETGEDDTVIITRNEMPVVKMTLYHDTPVSKIVGVAKGRLKTPVDLDRDNTEIEAMFGGDL